nr:unnamed protein product [Callosobruchus chinensis]
MQSKERQFDSSVTHP